ncbi:Phosphatidylcholine synthase [Bartonella ancashensis]|uniref:Phosphatidylcholine synthase n=1 Tax=Bartonella ancashensis TaxID=1318743 RepID=A0A0M4M2G4_9HYPH|nr:Phosphatidylcholine synthase [Bartonella ancashensis]
MPKVKAFSVHLLTASGSFLAFLSLVSASEKSGLLCFVGLGLLFLLMELMVRHMVDI